MVVVTGAEEGDVDVAVGIMRRRPRLRPADRQARDRLPASPAASERFRVEFERGLGIKGVPLVVQPRVDEQRVIGDAASRVPRPAADPQPARIEDDRDSSNAARGQSPPFDRCAEAELADLDRERLGQVREPRVVAGADDEDEF